MACDGLGGWEGACKPVWEALPAPALFFFVPYIIFPVSIGQVIYSSKMLLVFTNNAIHKTIKIIRPIFPVSIGLLSDLIFARELISLVVKYPFLSIGSIFIYYFLGYPRPNNTQRSKSFDN
jgi:hypothetical protein